MDQGQSGSVAGAFALITPALFSQPPPRPPGEEGEVCLSLFEESCLEESCLKPSLSRRMGGGWEREGWESEGAP
jgi:hypothetical protein